MAKHLGFASNRLVGVPHGGAKAVFFPDAIMLHFVAYDIRDSRRLKKIARLCLDYGVRMQYSIFEFDLDPGLTADFVQEMEAIIDPSLDRVMIVPVCGACRRHIRLLGQAEAYESPRWYCF